MRLLQRILPDQLVATYRRVKTILRGHDAVIFSAMEDITATRPHPFVGPVGVSEYAAKHQEIERLFKAVRVLNGGELALRLLERVASDAADQQLLGLDPREVLNAISFRTDLDGVDVRLSEDSRWIGEWTVSLLGPPHASTPILLDIHKEGWGEIVPNYVVQYLAAAADAFHRGLTAVAAALLSIATEATLRDALAPRGYVFKPGATGRDIYARCKADLAVTGTAYSLTFKQPMPKDATSFVGSTGGNASIEVEIRRELATNGVPPVFELEVRLPPSILDHLSSDQVVQSAQKQIGGLGEALRIAREVERILLPEHLPEDFDAVLKSVRNNLIHLSGAALQQPIPGIPDPITHQVPITLGRFLESPSLVYDLFLSVPTLINEQYVALRQAGH